MRLFGTSGIRGVVGDDLTVELCRTVGQALGVVLPTHAKVCVASDTRLSRDVVKGAVTSTLLSSGVDVTDFGILPTPALALLTREKGFDTGVMITASHNPPECNGIKLFNRDSMVYSRVQEAVIEEAVRRKDLKISFPGMLCGDASCRQTYFDFIRGKLCDRRFSSHLKVVVDPGNGAAAAFASELFSSMGLRVIPLNDEADGCFPGRSPDPKGDTLQGTIEFLRQQKADLAVCFDGDADRVVFCDREGFIGLNEMIAFISRMAVRDSGKKWIATTVETGRLLEMAVRDLGAEVIRGMVGDSDVAYLARDVDAAIGVEAVGVYILPEVGFYPDSMFAALLLLSEVRHTNEIRRFLAQMPRLFFEKTKIRCPNEMKEEVMGEVMKRARLFMAKYMNMTDGLRLEYDDAWMLIRTSGTEPAIRVMVESTSRATTMRLLAAGVEAIHSCLARVEI